MLPCYESEQEQIRFRWKAHSQSVSPVLVDYKRGALP